MEYPILVVPETLQKTVSYARRARRFGCAFKVGAKCVRNGPPGLSQMAPQRKTSEAQLTSRLEPLLTVTAVSCSLLSSIVSPCRRTLRDPETPEALPVHSDDKNSKKEAIQEAQNDVKEESDIEGILNFTAAIQQQKRETVLDTEDDWIAQLFYGTNQTPSLQAQDSYDSDDDSLCPVLSFSTNGDILRLSAVSTRHAATIAELSMSSDTQPPQSPFLTSVPPSAARLKATDTADTVDGGPVSFTRMLVNKHMRLVKQDDDIDEALLQRLETFWLTHPEHLPHA